MRIEGLSELSPIGSGGFSQVFRAAQPRYDRAVAAKVLSFELETTAERDGFEAECRAMGQLSEHPHIVPLYSTTYTEDGRPVIVMQYFTGGTLLERLKEGGGLDEAEILDVGVKVAAALDFAHERGVVHRDVKPQNILFSRFGEPALTDFGISAITSHTSEIDPYLGLTLDYTAPETLNGPATPVSDVYSLASTLYRAFAGRTPFGTVGAEQSAEELAHRLIHENALPLQAFGCDDAFDMVVRISGMAKAPAARPQSARQFGEALRELQAERGHPVTPWIDAADELDADQADQATVTNPVIAAPAAAVADDLARVDDEDSTTLRRWDAAAAQEPEYFDEEEEAEEQAERDRARKRKRRIIAALVTVLLLLATAAFLFFFVFNDGGSTSSDDPDAEPTPEPPVLADPQGLTIERGLDLNAVVEWLYPAEEPPMFEVERVVELPDVAPADTPCVRVRAVREGSTSSGWVGPACLAPKLGDDPVISVVPPQCAPGACDFTLDGSGFLPGASLSVRVENSDGVDLNEQFGEVYPAAAEVQTNGAIDWRFSPGTSATPGRYRVTVTDDGSGAAAVDFLELLDESS